MAIDSTHIDSLYQNAVSTLQHSSALSDSIFMQLKQVATSKPDWLVMLFAIIPSVIIGILYNFLAAISTKLFDLEQLDREDQKPAVSSIEEFIVLTSKYFHLTLFYYLVVLTATIMGHLLRYFDAANWAAFGIFFGVGYSIWYTRNDIWSARNKFLVGVDEKGVKRIRNMMRYFCMEFFAIPICAALLILLCPCDQSQVYLISITLTLIQIINWWMTFPIEYQPMTKLAELAKAVAVRRHTNNTKSATDVGSQ